MPTTNGNRKILDLKRWEWLSPAPAATAAGAFCAISRHYRQQVLYVTGITTAWLYNPNEDGWVALPSPALTPTIGAGSSGIAVGWSTGASAISFAGVSTVTTVTTLANQTNIGGISAADQMPALYKIAGESLRRNITVS